MYDYYNNFTPSQIEAMVRGSAEYINGSHADGLWRVPFDGYRAELHAGERVLTASQARADDSGYAELVAEVRELRREVSRQTAVSADGMTRGLNVQQDIARNTAASAQAALLESVRGVTA